MEIAREHAGEWAHQPAVEPAPVGDTTAIAKITFFGQNQEAFRRTQKALGDRFHIITGTMP